MYIIFGCLLLIVLICFPLFFLRKKRACKKVCAMSFQEKCDTLETLISPFGYCYNASQDVFSTRVDAPSALLATRRPSTVTPHASAWSSTAFRSTLTMEGVPG